VRLAYLVIPCGISTDHRSEQAAVPIGHLGGGLSEAERLLDFLAAYIAELAPVPADDRAIAAVHEPATD
jgi:hypothetical protein